MDTSANNMRRLKLLLLIVVMNLGNNACNSSERLAVDMERRLPDLAIKSNDLSRSPDMSPSDLSAVASDSGSTDQNTVPHLSVVVTPSHLTSNWGKDRLVKLSWVNMGVTDHKTAEADLRVAFSVVSLPGEKTVNGTLNLDMLSRVGTFTPSPVWTGDTDYLVRVKKTGYVVPNREYTQFRIGSLPRLRRIGLRAMKSNLGELEYIGFIFSEEVDRANVIAGLTVMATKSGVALSMKPQYSTGMNAGVLLYPPAGTKMAEKLSITIGTDVGAKTGVKLDGKYTGKAGSGSFTVELVPADHASNSWEPKLTY